MLVFPVAFTPYGSAAQYFSTKGIMSTPGDTPSNRHFAGRVMKPASLQRSMVAWGRVRGRSEYSVSTAELANPDGELDDLLPFRFEGQPFIQYVGEDGGVFPTDFDVLVTTAMSQPECSRTAMSIYLKDRTAILDMPIQTDVFLGTNTLPDGLEGVDDIKGKAKQLVFGKVRNAPLTCVNTSLLIYLAAANGLTALTAVREGAATLTAGAAYATLADLLATAPVAGQYRVYLAGGYVRFGSSPGRPVTFDGYRNTRAGGLTIGGVIEDVFGQTKLTEGTDYASGIAAVLDPDYPGDAGICVSTERVPEVLDRCVNTFGGFWFCPADGVIDVGVFVDPRPETAVASFAAKDMLEPLRQIALRDDEGVQVWRVRCRFNRNYTVQASDLSGSVSDADRALYAQEWQEVFGESNQYLRGLESATANAGGTIDTDFSLSGTPIVTSVTGPFGTGGYEVEDDAAGAVEYIYRTVVAPSDGAQPVGVWVKKDTGAVTVIGLYDVTSAAYRMKATITWVGATPGTPVMTNGTYLSQETDGSGWYFLLFLSTACTAAHTHRMELYPTSLVAATTGKTQFAYPGFGPAQPPVPRRPEMLIETLWADEDDARTEATRQFSLRAERRMRLQFPVAMTPANLARELGHIIEVDHSRFGLSGGVNFALIGIHPQPSAKVPQILFDVWGIL